MRIPVTAARSLFQLFVSRDYPNVSRAVEQRLELIDLDLEFLRSTIDQMASLELELLSEIPEIEDWPGLSGEFAALSTWLLQDLKTSSSSTEFDKAVWRMTAEHLSSFVTKLPNSPTLRLKIRHWAVGACWSSENWESAVVFPLKALGLSKEQATKAYDGLVEQLQSLEFLDLGREAGADSEVALTSIPIRVCGLAEALNPGLTGAKDALPAQIAKLGGQAGTETKMELRRVWNEDAFAQLVDERNSIAHISRDASLTFTNAVNHMDRARAHALGALASTLIAAEILSRLEDLDDTRVLHWVRQVQSQLDSRNLVHLIPNRFSKVVTPLG